MLPIDCSTNGEYLIKTDSITYIGRRGGETTIHAGGHVLVFLQTEEQYTAFLKDML